MKVLTREEFEAQAAIPKTPEELELIRKRKEIRSKIFAEAIANNEMVDTVLERYRKERREKEAEVRSQETEVKS